MANVILAVPIATASRQFPLRFLQHLSFVAFLFVWMPFEIACASSATKYFGLKSAPWNSKTAFLTELNTKA
ncbi:hypothetical protein BpHYR1_040220 [Brachionus plicatilis]|uniref:Uncharacterized protein n=1 Tax=Brachionus plicatilis TaxID=10195 RepID=A0A3M7S1W2_BRAPC|nr:hypothetical protein BpHYR1_040220 [Brachionus plicatilis]